MKKRILAGLLALLALLAAACTGGQTVELTPPLTQTAGQASPTPKGDPTPGALGECWVLFLNVGKADCALLCIDGLYYLVDTGTKKNAEALIQTLRALGVTALEGVFLTHTHGDHAGGAKKLAAAIPVSMFYRASITTLTKKGKDALSDIAADAGVPETKLEAGDRLSLSGATMEVLGPVVYHEEDDNDNSLVLRLTANGHTVLFTGDMQFAQEETLLEQNLAAEVLKVGNHGNPDATSEAFAAAVGAKIAVISTDTSVDTDSANARVISALAGATIYVTEHFTTGVKVDLSGSELLVSDPGFDPGQQAAALYDSFTAQLINRAHMLEADYVPQTLVEIGESPELTLKEAGMMGDALAVAALMEMAAAAKEAGVTGFYLVSVYRTYREQQSLWDRKVAANASYGSDPSIPVVTAYPGASEHQSGLAFDISAVDARALSADFAQTPQGIWLYANSWRFGFIVRYPQDEQSILETGIVFEPWHFRYVGKPLAAYLYRTGMTLECFYAEFLPQSAGE